MVPMKKMKEVKVDVDVKAASEMPKLVVVVELTMPRRMLRSWKMGRRYKPNPVLDTNYGHEKHDASMPCKTTEVMDENGQNSLEQW